VQTTPNQAELLAELYERCARVSELDAPQIEAWVSGLFAVFDDELPADAFVAYCREQQSEVGGAINAALSYLASGFDEELAAEAGQASEVIVLPDRVAGIGQSPFVEAWEVRAPFGRSVVLGFDPPPGAPDPEEGESDGCHSILVELSKDGELLDLQLTGRASTLVNDAVESDERVQVESLELDRAVRRVIDAWRTELSPTNGLGPGVAANQHFVRQRLRQLSGELLPLFTMAADPQVDIRRGLDDQEFEAANKASLSTLVAALGAVEPAPASLAPLAAAMANVVRGDVHGVTSREQDALLWLEWADWLGVVIGLTRSGVGAQADGPALVDYVNRCPEVSSTIDKGDREYAEWAFDVAFDLLADIGVVEDGVLTAVGHETVAPALLVAWSQGVEADS